MQRMEANFRIKIGDDNLPYQQFNGKNFKLQPKEKYFNNGSVKMHWYVWEFYNGKRPKGFHIHHKDGNTWNNEIENLELVESKKHLSEHIKNRIQNNKEWFDDFQKKGIERATEWHKSPEGIEWHKLHAKNCNFGATYKQEHECQQCGKKYISKQKFGKYCHQNCKAKALRYRRKLERTSI